MKKMLIAITLAFLAVAATASTADAGHKVKYLAGYDSCGRPIYSYRYVPTYTPRCYTPPSYGYSQSYQPSYRSGFSFHYSQRPSYSHHGGGHGNSRGNSHGSHHGRH
jgi:opacity protein-like surface antigen